MTYSVTIHDKIRGTEITFDGFSTVTDAKLAAESHIHKNALDAGYCSGLAEASVFSQNRYVTIDVFAENKKPVTYCWKPIHPRYEPQLVLRGGYFRKVVA